MPSTKAKADTAKRFEAFDEYRRILERTASTIDYRDVSYRLYDAAKKLCVLSNIASTADCDDGGPSQELLATSIYRVRDLIEFAQALDAAAQRDPEPNEAAKTVGQAGA